MTAPRFKLVDSFREAMQVRKLRNSCRLDLTNSRDHIGLLRQGRWYFSEYVQARSTGAYRLYLIYNDEYLPVGYGALRLNNEGLFITECVGPKHRRQGYGLTILRELIQIARDEGRDLVAEIWATNVSSIALHQKVGFEFESSSQKDGNELQRHRLRHQQLTRD